jgi:DNA-binding NarL/FixJ family response regulator
MFYLSLSPGRASNRVKKRVTVLLVDDHALVRRGFRRVIEDETGITVVGEVGDGAQAVQMARKLKPAVVLMDCSLVGMDGVFAAREIVKSCPNTAVLMCSMHSEATWVRRAVEAGASGYIPKSAMDCDLGSAILRVAAGELVFPSDLSEQRKPKTKGKCGLSARQLEILQFIVNGKSNREIAIQLGLSEHTVAAHRANIMNTLHIKKTAELVTYAIRNGLASIP